MSVDAGRLLEEIRQSGFPAELRIAATFRSHGWRVVHSVGFADLDDKRHREISLRCHKLSADPDEGIAVGSYLSIVARKSAAAPWVVFCSDADESELEDIGLQYCTRNFERDLLAPADLIAGHPAQSAPRLGRASYGGRTEGDEGTAGLSSTLLLAVKSAIDERLYCERLLQDEFDEDGDEDDGADDSPWLAFFNPVVIVDGDLFACFIDRNGEIALSREPYIPYLVNYGSEAYGTETYCVDIISADFVEAYIRLQERWIVSVVLPPPGVAG